MKKLICLFFVCALCALTACGPSDLSKFTDALNNDDIPEAYNIYSTKLWESDKYSIEALSEVENYVSGLESRYKSGGLEYLKAIENLKALTNFSNVSEECLLIIDNMEKLHLSNLSYDEGIKLIDEKRFIKALNKLSLVIDEDTNYADALQKIEYAKTLYRDQINESIKLLSDSDETDKICDLLKEALSFFPDDREYSELLDKYDESSKLTWIVQPQFDYENIIAWDFSYYGSNDVRGGSPADYTGMSVYQKDGKWGVIDKNGKIIVDSLNNVRWSLTTGFVSNKKNIGFDYQGNEIKPSPFGFDPGISYSISANSAFSWREEKVDYLYSLDSARILPVYESIGSEYTTSSSELVGNKTYAFVGLDGTSPTCEEYTDFVLLPEYQSCKEITFGAKNSSLSSVTSMVGVRTKNDDWKFIDEYGQDTALGTFEKVLPFHNNIAAVKKDGKWGYIDSTGGQVLPFIFDNASSVSDNEAWVEYREKWGKISIGT